MNNQYEERHRETTVKSQSFISDTEFSTFIFLIPTAAVSLVTQIYLGFAIFQQFLPSQYCFIQYYSSHPFLMTKK